jgi:ribonucleoside-diphosphate reductase alpha chain
VYDLKCESDTWCPNDLLSKGCGELPSITRDENGNPQAGMCCLGSLVFPNFYDEEDGYNLDLLGKVIEIAVLMLDNLIENGNYPIALNEETMKAYRPIGIGGLGLADLLFLNKIKYGDDESTLFMQELLCDIENLAYSSSKKLAKELGPFPKYDKDKDVCGGPRRNSTLISFAPTGTISALYGASWGIEPYYAVSMTRNEELGKATTGFTVLDNWRKEHPKEPWPSYLSVVKSGNEDIQELTVQDHLYMLSTIAQFADNSISKTINMPHDATVTDVMEAYEFCWRNEIKGCTVYREGCRSVNAVEVEGADYSEQDEEDYDIEFVDLVAQPREIPVEASASRYKLKYNPEKPSLYLTLTDDGHGPLEIFFNTMDAQAKETLDGMALSITSLFRRGIDASHLLEKYKRYESPNGGGWYKGKYVPSLLAGVAMVVEDHFTKMGYLTDEAYLKQLETENMSDSGRIEGERCPNCGMYTLIPVEGCVMCTSCGYSKCG